VLKLIVDSPTGHFDGTKELRSGSEIYGKDLYEAGIKKDQPITVLASRLDRGMVTSSPRQKTQNRYLLPSEDKLVSLEGGRVTVQVNRFERDPAARRRCIQIFGTRCVVCGFDFAKTYGEIGAGFIHVHHLRPLSVNRKTHRVDVRRDLRPVCPNCHEMLHRKKPAPLSIEALKAKISK
jgi:predicted HNH restriction endonuclease